MIKKHKRYKIGVEIGDFYKGTAKRKFVDGFYDELYRGEPEVRARLIKAVIIKTGNKVHIVKKKRGYSVYMK